MPDHNLVIRAAKPEDVPRMVELSELKRTLYAKYSPIFWRKASDASEKQSLFFHAQVGNEQNDILVAEQNGIVEGFVFARVTTAPPVYDPGGKVCMIDDFAVSSQESWHTVGRVLLSAATERAKARGAVLSVIVCGHLDEPKRAMLKSIGAEIASEWYTLPIT